MGSVVWHDVRVALYDTFIVLNHVVCRCLGDPKAFPGVPWGQNHFHNIEMLFIFHYVNMCADGAKVIVGKTLVPKHTLRQWH